MEENVKNKKKFGFPPHVKAQKTKLNAECKALMLLHYKHLNAAYWGCDVITERRSFRARSVDTSFMLLFVQ